MVPPKYVAEKGNAGLKPVGRAHAASSAGQGRPAGVGPSTATGGGAEDRVVYKPIPEPFTRAAALLC
jgi:hypothetical protein